MDFINIPKFTFLKSLKYFVFTILASTLFSELSFAQGSRTQSQWLVKCSNMVKTLFSSNREPPPKINKSLTGLEDTVRDTISQARHQSALLRESTFTLAKAKIFEEANKGNIDSIEDYTMQIHVREKSDAAVKSELIQILESMAVNQPTYLVAEFNSQVGDSMIPLSFPIFGDYQLVSRDPKGHVLGVILKIPTSIHNRLQSDWEKMSGVSWQSIATEDLQVQDYDEYQVIRIPIEKISFVALPNK